MTSHLQLHQLFNHATRKRRRGRRSCGRSSLSSLPSSPPPETDITVSSSHSKDCAIGCNIVFGYPFLGDSLEFSARNIVVSNYINRAEGLSSLSSDEDTRQPGFRSQTSLYEPDSGKTLLLFHASRHHSFPLIFLSSCQPFFEAKKWFFIFLALTLFFLSFLDSLIGRERINFPVTNQRKILKDREECELHMWCLHQRLHLFFYHWPFTGILFSCFFLSLLLQVFLSPFFTSTLFSFSGPHNQGNYLFFSWFPFGWEAI